MAEKDLPSQEIQDALKHIVQHFDKEDRSVRERQIREYRRNKFYWDGLTNIFWSQTNHDWRIIDTYTDVDYNEIQYYDKRINVYQAYLESIIAAVTAGAIGLKAYPDDAENPLDITTAKAFDKAYEILKKQNNAPLQQLHIMFIMATEGPVYVKVCKDTDKKYGVTKTPNFEDYTEDHYVCPNCGEMLDDELFAPVSPELQGIGPFCPNCEGQLDPNALKIEVQLKKITGYNEEPKSRVKFEIFGGLFVKTPIYARCQEECLYLMYSYETHYANIRKEYPHLSDAFIDGYNSQGFNEPYEKWGRLSTQYLGDFPANTLTCKHTWLRPEAFYILKDDEIQARLLKNYPDGCCVTLIEDRFAEVVGAKLDDEWVMTKNPLGDYTHFQPLGTKLVDVQDMTNELISLTLQTIEHGIPQTFVDPNVLNFNEYGETSVRPGEIYPATPKAGKSLADAFHEVKTSTLSQEVMPFAQNLQTMAQLSSGALPSLFGGANVSGSDTASEYSMSKNQAMQRLQNIWKITTNLWKDMYALAIPAFMECIVEDEKFVQKDDNGNFINVWIRKAELDGNVGSIELDGADNLPSTWQQKKDTLMQFLQAANPVVLQALVDPVNLPVLAEAVGLADIELPGFDDRTKQYEEISLLLNSTPITMPGMIPDPMTGQEVEDPTGGQLAPPQEVASIEVEPEIDNHQVHIAICKSWAVGEAGRLAKVENPEGYKNVLLHLQQHMMFAQQDMMNQAMMVGGPPQEDAGNTPPANDKMAAPVKNGSMNNG